MKHPNAALDLTDEDTYTRAQVEAMKRGPKYSEALRWQRFNELHDHVVIVEFVTLVEGGDKVVSYKIRDRRTQVLIHTEHRLVPAQAFATAMNLLSDEDYPPAVVEHLKSQALALRESIDLSGLSI